MLKINLLPPYIFERRKVRQTAILFGMIFMVVLGGMVGWWIVLGQKEAALKVEVADMQAKAQQVLQLEATIKAEEDKIPPIKERMDYFRAVMSYNTKFPALYEELTKYTYERVLYRSIQPSNNALTIQAHAKSLGDAGRYLLNMYRAKHLFSNVSMSAVPGYPSNLMGGFDFSVTCSLVSPIDAPPIPAGLGGGAVGTGTDASGGTYTPSPVGGPTTGPDSGAPSGPPLEEPPPPGLEGG